MPSDKIVEKKEYGEVRKISREEEKLEKIQKIKAKVVPAKTAVLKTMALNLVSLNRFQEQNRDLFPEQCTVKNSLDGAPIFPGFW